MRFVLFSDLHLDTHFAWAGPSVARRRRQALRDTLDRIVDLALEVGPHAVLCGGDLYEHERFSPDTAEFVRRAFERLHPTPVYVAPGNHDWFGEQSLYRRVSWPPNVHIFEGDARGLSSEELRELARDLEAEAPAVDPAAQRCLELAQRSLDATPRGRLLAAVVAVGGVLVAGGLTVADARGFFAGSRGAARLGDRRVGPTPATCCVGRVGTACYRCVVLPHRSSP